MRAVLKTFLLSWAYYFSYDCKWQKYYAWSVTYLHISHVLIFSHGTCSHIVISHMFSYCHISHIIMLSHVHMFTCCHMLVCKCLEQKPNICFHMWVHCLRKYDMSHVTCHMWRHKINFCGRFRKTLIKWTTHSKNKQWFIIAFWKPNYSKVVSMIHQTKFGPYTIHARHLDIRKVNQYK